MGGARLMTGLGGNGIHWTRHTGLSGAGGCKKSLRVLYIPVKQQFSVVLCLSMKMAF